MSRAQRFDQAAIAGLVCLSTWLLVGDFDVRLANTSTDDGIVRYAWFFKYPELFQHDARNLNWVPLALGSMQNWLPALLFKYLDVPPEFFYRSFTFLQNVLLALAVYRYTTVAVGSREAAWIAALFTLAFRSHWWNAGLFADCDWFPYAAWMALPFLVYAGAFALEGRGLATAAAVLVGGLIHPVLGLFAALIFCAYAALVWVSDRDTRRLLAWIGALGLVVLASMLPTVISQAGMDKAPLELILPKILGNGHTVPWANPGCAYCMPLFVRNLALIAVLSALGIAAVARVGGNRNVRLFLSACIAVPLALCLLHAFAYASMNAALLRIIGPRSTILLLAFVTPLVVALLWREFVSTRAPLRLPAGFALLLPSAAAFLAALLVLVSSRLLGPGRKAEIYVRLCAGLGWMLFVLTLARHVAKLGPRIDLHVVGKFLEPETIPLVFGYHAVQFRLYSTWVVICLCALVAWQWLAARRSGTASPPSRPITTALYALGFAAPIAFYLVMWNQQSGKWATSGEARTYYEVQAWARTSTLPGAEFIVANTSVYEGWRNFSRRPQIAPEAICAVYLCTRAALAYDAKIAQFYAQAGKASYVDLDAAGLREFARNFGGHYAVRRKSWTTLTLPVAYENADYVVYRVR